MQRTRHRFGFMAAAILPLLLGGCLSGGVPGGDGFGYRPVFRTAHGTAGMGHPAPGAGARQLALAPDEIGRASGRERGCQYVSISVAAVTLKNKKQIITTNKSTPT